MHPTIYCILVLLNCYNSKPTIKVSIPPSGSAHTRACPGAWCPAPAHTARASSGQAYCWLPCPGAYVRCKGAWICWLNCTFLTCRGMFMPRNHALRRVRAGSRGINMPLQTSDFSKCVVQIFYCCSEASISCRCCNLITEERIEGTYSYGILVHYCFFPVEFRSLIM